MGGSSIAVMIIGCLTISSPEDFPAVEEDVQTPIPELKMEAPTKAPQPIEPAQPATVATSSPAKEVAQVPKQSPSLSIAEGAKDPRFLLLLSLMMITNCNTKTASD
jgi:hypothetical protein